MCVTMNFANTFHSLGMKRREERHTINHVKDGEEDITPDGKTCNRDMESVGLNAVEHME